MFNPLLLDEWLTCNALLSSFFSREFIARCRLSVPCLCSFKRLDMRCFDASKETVCFEFPWFHPFYGAFFFQLLMGSLDAWLVPVICFSFLR